MRAEPSRASQLTRSLQYAYGEAARELGLVATKRA